MRSIIISNNNMNIKGKIQRGFTILEVIIVLVIAAIIMLAAFIQQAQTGPIMTNTAYPLNGTSSLWLNGIIGLLRAPNGSTYSVTYRNAISNANFLTLSTLYNAPNRMLVVTQACGSIAAQPTATTSTEVYSVTFYQYQAIGFGSGCTDISK